MSFDFAIQTRKRETAPMSEAEWKVRVDLAACYRLTARFGWDDLVATHISARVPGPGHYFLLNPYGMAFEEITASSLVKVDLDGTIVGDSPYTINAAGFLIHGAVHEARPEVGCVMHTHTEVNMAMSMLPGGFRSVSQHALKFHNRIGYHEFEGIALDTDEKKRLVADLGTHNVMILRNHGFLTCGKTIAEAFLHMFYLEKSSAAQLRAMAAGEGLVEVNGQVAEKTARQYEADAETVSPGSREWPAMLRRLDREDPSYRD
jgi:ribulose-5-phosphate 4-epimerase/fuculose-1-phosphate aldolase